MAFKSSVVDESDTWLTLEQAAKHIKKSQTHLRMRLKDKIGFSKPGKEIVFRLDDLNAYLMKHYHPAKD